MTSNCVFSELPAGTPSVMHSIGELSSNACASPGYEYCNPAPFTPPCTVHTPMRSPPVTREYASARATA